MSKLKIKDYDYYIVMTDDNDNFIISYGIEGNKPTIGDIKNVINLFQQETDIRESIPNFEKVKDYITIQIMKHKKFMKYMDGQNND